jgi:hypothetical protein
VTKSFNAKTRRRKAETKNSFASLPLCAFAFMSVKKKPAIDDLLKVMAKLRSPKGCPWDREQDHLSLRWHAVEEVYELLDAIESRDDHEMEE